MRVQINSGVCCVSKGGLTKDSARHNCISANLKFQSIILHIRNTGSPSEIVYMIESKSSIKSEECDFITTILIRVTVRKY